MSVTAGTWNWVLDKTYKFQSLQGLLSQVERGHNQASLWRRDGLHTRQITPSLSSYRPTLVFSGDLKISNLTNSSDTEVGRVDGGGMTVTPSHYNQKTKAPAPTVAVYFKLSPTPNANLLTGFLASSLPLYTHCSLSEILSSH